jgi:hypothetical protein
VDSDGDVTTGSQQFQRFRFVASGGETTISGADANGAVLAYTAGLEQVVLNGAVLVRGFDYTATTGTTITGLSPALVASDVLEVFSFIAFTVANTYTQSQVDGLLADYAGLRLLTPTSADNGTIGTSGAVSFTSASSVSLNGCFTSTYNNYKVLIYLTSTSGSNTLRFRIRAAGADLTTGTYRTLAYYSNSAANSFSGLESSSTGSYGALSYSGVQGNAVEFDIFNPKVADYTHLRSTSTFADSTNMFLLNSGTVVNNTTSYDGFTIYPAAAAITGTVRVYGYKN